MPYEADLLLVNANVLTIDPARPRAGAVAVRGDRIAGVYDGDPGVRAANVIDLKGATLLPGFHDAHNHMIGFGLTLTEADLRVTSLEELYARVEARTRLFTTHMWPEVCLSQTRRPGAIRSSTSRCGWPPVFVWS